MAYYKFLKILFLAYKNDEMKGIVFIFQLNSDGYGSHTSPTRAPLVTDECDAPADETDTLTPSEVILRYRECCQPDTVPKNAK